MRIPMPYFMQVTNVWNDFFRQRFLSITELEYLTVENMLGIYSQLRSAFCLHFYDSPQREWALVIHVINLCLGLCLSCLFCMISRKDKNVHVYLHQISKGYNIIEIFVVFFNIGTHLLLSLFIHSIYLCT